MLDLDVAAADLCLRDIQPSLEQRASQRTFRPTLFQSARRVVGSSNCIGTIRNLNSSKVASLRGCLSFVESTFNGCSRSLIAVQAKAPHGACLYEVCSVVLHSSSSALSSTASPTAMFQSTGDSASVTVSPYSFQGSFFGIPIGTEVSSAPSSVRGHDTRGLDSHSAPQPHKPMADQSSACGQLKVQPGMKAFAPAGLAHPAAVHLSNSSSSRNCLRSIPSAFTSGAPAAVGGMTSLYGKLRTAAVLSQPAVQSSPEEAAKQDCFTLASSTASHACSWQSKPCGSGAGSTISGQSSTLPQLHMSSISSAVPRQCSLFSNSSFPTSQSSSRPSSLGSRSTTSSIHAADQGQRLSLVGAALPTVCAAEPGSPTGEELLAALGLSGPDQVDSTQDQEVLLSLLLSSRDCSTSSSAAATAAAGPVAPSAALNQAIPTAAPHSVTPEERESMLVQMQQLFINQAAASMQPALAAGGVGSSHTAALADHDLLQKSLLMQQLQDLQQQPHQTLNQTTHSSSNTDLLGGLDAASGRNLHALLGDQYGMLAGAEPSLLLHTQAAAQQFTHSSSAALADASSLLGLSQQPAPQASSQQLALAHLMAQLQGGSSFSTGSSNLGTVNTGSSLAGSQNPFLGDLRPAGFAPLDTGSDAVAAALAALKPKMVLGATGTGSSAAAAGGGMFGMLPGLATAQSAIDGLLGLPPQQATGPLGPGSNPMYKTELCRTWMETGGCRYGSRCQFAHGANELRPIQRHPKYKTQLCRTFALHGTCPYGDRCNFIHNSVLGPQAAAASAATAPGLLQQAAAVQGAS